MGLEIFVLEKCAESHPPPPPCVYDAIGSVPSMSFDSSVIEILNYCALARQIQKCTTSNANQMSGKYSGPSSFYIYHIYAAPPLTLSALFL